MRLDELKVLYSHYLLRTNYIIRPFSNKVNGAAGVNQKEDCYRDS